MPKRDPCDDDDPLVMEHFGSSVECTDKAMASLPTPAQQLDYLGRLTKHHGQRMIDIGNALRTPNTPPAAPVATSAL